MYVEQRIKADLAKLMAPKHFSEQIVGVVGDILIGPYSDSESMGICTVGDFRNTLGFWDDVRIVAHLNASYTGRMIRALVLQKYRMINPVTVMSYTTEYEEKLIEPVHKALVQQFGTRTGPIEPVDALVKKIETNVAHDLVTMMQNLSK